MIMIYIVMILIDLLKPWLDSLHGFEYITNHSDDANWLVISRVLEFSF